MLDDIHGKWEMAATPSETTLLAMSIFNDSDKRDNIPVAYKKVLMITPFNPNGIGGAETFVKGLADEANKKHLVGIATLDRQFNDWDNTSMFTGLKIAVRLLIRSLAMRHSFKYQTVHCMGVIATAVGVVLKKIYKIKLISTTVALYDFLSFPFPKLDIVRWLFKHVDVMFVEDQLGREEALKGLQIPANKIKTFMHWVDMDRFKPGKAYYSKKGLHVLFIGRPIYKKGKHIIAQAERELKKQKLKMEFEYVENVPHEDLPDYYRNADVFVIPSLYDEGVARVVLEAATCGCAVISSGYGSLRELVKPFGIVISPKVELYKKKLIRLYMCKKLLKSYQTKALDYARQNFTKKNAKIFIEEY